MLCQGLYQRQKAAGYEVGSRLRKAGQGAEQGLRGYGTGRPIDTQISVV